MELISRGAIEATQLLATEYVQLKEEQRLRIDTRDNLLYATLGSLAVIAAGTIQTGHPLLLLLVPPVSVILGWTYLVNDNRITAIGRYIEGVITPALATYVGPNVPVLAWETAHRTGSGRRVRKIWQAAVDLLTFVASAMTALALIATTIRASTIATGVLVAEAAASCLLAYQIIAQAVRGGRRRSAGA